MNGKYILHISFAMHLFDLDLHSIHIACVAHVVTHLNYDLLQNVCCIKKSLSGFEIGGSSATKSCEMHSKCMYTNVVFDNIVTKL